jgi:hypothetical protein
MLLLGEVTAALLAGVLGALAWTRKVTPASVARWIFVLATVFAYLFFWGHLWSISHGFWSDRSTWDGVPREKAAAAGAVESDADLRTGFADWIHRRLKTGDSFYLVPAKARSNAAVYQWFTYRLLPSLSTPRPDEAKWLIFYGTSPARSGFSGWLAGTAEQYERNYSIARIRHAS